MSIAISKMPSQVSGSQDQSMQDAPNGNEVTGNTASPEPVLEFGEQRIRVVSLPYTFGGT